MLFFILGLASIATCVLQGIIYGWLINNESNSLHNIVNLWTKDPLEKAFFVSVDSDCPNGTSEENLTYSYGGRSELCACETTEDTYSDRYLKGTTQSSTKTNPTTQPIIYYQECSEVQCKYRDQEKVTKVDSISSATFHNFFSGQKLCTSRIKGYSFAKKAPEDYSCGSDEKYCSWNSKNQVFDIDHGYCIPNNRECYLSGVQVPKSQDKDILQLPLVQYEFSDTNSDRYNTINIENLQEKTLLELNDVDYPAGYSNQLTQPYVFQSIYMPRVKARCRASLKNTLSSYIGPKKAGSISLASMIFSIFAALIQFFYAGIGDICDLKDCEKNGCQSYCEAKRFNIKNTKIRNTLLIAKPVLLLILLILNTIIAKNYIPIFFEFDHMIEEECLDQYVKTAIGYGEFFNSSYFDFTQTYVSILLVTANFLFDQNVYFMIKTIILVAFCQEKCPCSKQQETKNTVQPFPQADTKKELKKTEENKEVNIQTLSGVQQDPVLNKNVNFSLQEKKKRLSSLFKRKDSSLSSDSKDIPKDSKDVPKDSVPKNIDLKDSEKLNKKIKKIQEKILKLESKLKYDNLTQDQSDEIKQSIQKKTKKLNQKLAKKKDQEISHDVLKNINVNIGKKKEKKVHSDENVFKNIDTHQGSNTLFKNDIFDQEKGQNSYNQFGDNPMNFHKINTKEIIQPPDAPAPPEQSEQLNNSIREDDIFSQK